jgi:hypothetical protein
MYTYGTTPADFKVGDAVRFHPATDAWMQGDTGGYVVKVGRSLVHVRTFRSQRTLRMLPINVELP